MLRLDPTLSARLLMVSQEARGALFRRPSHLILPDSLMMVSIHGLAQVLEDMPCNLNSVELHPWHCLTEASVPRVMRRLAIRYLPNIVSSLPYSHLGSARSKVPKL